jgi:hypothetical protein
MSHERVFIDKFILAGMLLNCIREVPSSNIGQETYFSDRGLSWFPSVPTPFSQSSTGVGPQIWAQPLPFIHYSLSILQFDYLFLLMIC